jgi:hypothetical protein
MTDKLKSLIWAIIFIAAIMAVGCAMSGMMITTNWRREAVKHHAATWTTTADGNVKWKWNDEIEKVQP